MKGSEMVKARLFVVVVGLLIPCITQGMFKQSTKSFILKTYGNYLRLFSTLSAEEVALSKKKIADIQRLQHAESFSYALCSAGIRLDNHKLHNQLTAHYEKNLKKLGEEFNREIEKLKAHYTTLQPDKRI
jgi:hypothetical protein